MSSVKLSTEGVTFQVSFKSLHTALTLFTHTPAYLATASLLTCQNTSLLKALQISSHSHILYVDTHHRMMADEGDDLELRLLLHFGPVSFSLLHLGTA